MIVVCLFCIVVAFLMWRENKNLRTMLAAYRQWGAEAVENNRQLSDVCTMQQEMLERAGVEMIVRPGMSELPAAPSNVVPLFRPRT